MTIFPFLMLLLLVLPACVSVDAPNASAPLTPRRIVFLGDSITDGHTYPALIAQALKESGRKIPIVTNAGIGGDTARGMAARIDQDVLRYKPDLMTLSVGINDVLRGVDPEAYEADVEKILDAVTRAGVNVIVMTTSTLGPKQAAADVKLERFNAALRRAAAKRQLRVADVNALMKQAAAENVPFMEVDDVHPNFEGQRILARAVLDAMGYADVPVPAALTLEPMPGLITRWKLRPAEFKTEKEVTESIIFSAMREAASAAATWKDFTLPEPAPIDNVWLEQERKRGFAVTVDRAIGKSPLYLGVATIESDSENTVCFNTGGMIQALWVNGKNVYRFTHWRGWHAGVERISVPLNKGANSIVIVTAHQFFLSVTNDDRW